MSKNRFALAVSVALLGPVPVLSQAEVNSLPDGDYSQLDLTQDLYPEIYEVGDPDGSSGGDPLTGDPDDGAGPGDETDVLSFKICDSRNGETGRRTSISRSGSMITREVQCD